MKSETRALQNVGIASPCPAKWDDMEGNRQRRYCSLCRLNVYNLSEMSEEAAGRFVEQAEGRTCVAFYRRRDGTILTKDCPRGVRAAVLRLFGTATAIVTMIGFLVIGTAFGRENGRRTVAPGQTAGVLDRFTRWIHGEPQIDLFAGILCPPPSTPSAGGSAPTGSAQLPETVETSN